MKEKKPNMLINGGVGVVLLLIILGSLASPLLILVALLFIGFVSVANMVRIERLTLAKKETRPEKEIEPEIEDVPPEPPYQKGILKKARRFLTDGYTIEEIKEALSEKYTDSVVDLVIKELEE